MSGNPLNIVMFLGSVREGRMCNRVSTYVKSILESRNHTVTVLDPLEKPEFTFLKKPLHFYRPDDQPPEWLVEAGKIVEAADAYVVVCGEYNRCIPPALTSLVSHFPPLAFKCKPCGIAVYSMGPTGGNAAGMQLRQFLGELGMITSQFVFSTPVVHEAITEDGTVKSDKIITGTQKMITELEWYAEALKNHREKFGTY